MEDSLANAKLLSGMAAEQKTGEPTASGQGQPARPGSTEPRTGKPKDASNRRKPGAKTRKKPETAKPGREAEPHDAEKEIIRELQRQDEALDDMENRLQTARHGAAGQPSEITAYCVRCKEKRPIAGARDAVLKNGRPAVMGTCPVCGCRVSRIVKGRLSKQ